MVFKFHKNILSITEQGESLPEIKNIKEKPNANDILEYVYWNYDRDSLYHSILIHDRLKIVHSDKFAHVNTQGYKLFGKESAALVGKLELLQYSENERLMESMNKKISEYLQFWDKTKIKEDNHKLVSDTIERAEALLKMKERLANIINKESATKRMGSSGSSMIETMAQ